MIVPLDLDCSGRTSEVFLNGKKVEQTELHRRSPSLIPAADLLEPGTNVLALKLDHRSISENFIGGIVRPVLLCETAGE